MGVILWALRWTHCISKGGSSGAFVGVHTHFPQPFCTSRSYLADYLKPPYNIFVGLVCSSGSCPPICIFFFPLNEWLCFFNIIFLALYWMPYWHPNMLRPLIVRYTINPIEGHLICWHSLVLSKQYLLLVFRHLSHKSWCIGLLLVSAVLPRMCQVN